MPPIEWMNTWRASHPDWSYQLYDNDFVFGRRWRLQSHIDEYMKRGAYSGVADMVQYELLYEQGGFIAPADSICRKPVDDLFVEDLAYAVFENEILRGGLISPFFAAAPKNAAISFIIDDIEGQEPKKMGPAYLSTGNYMVGRAAIRNMDSVKILPSYTFNPRHLIGVDYVGEGEVYADQFFGSTTGQYKAPKMGYFEKWKWNRDIRHKRRYRKAAERNAEYFPITDACLAGYRELVRKFSV